MGARKSDKGFMSISCSDREAYPKVDITYTTPMVGLTNPYVTKRGMRYVKRDTAENNINRSRAVALLGALTDKIL